MAILLQANELEDERKLKRTRRGMDGSRVYKVNTGVVDVALFGNGAGPTPGLPVIGEAWDLVKAPYLVVTEIEPEREGGQNTDALNQTGGWTRVRVRYETIIGGNLPPPTPGLTFARISPGVTQVQQIYGIDPATGLTIPGDPQLADGQGAARDVGVTAYEVFRGLSQAQFGALSISNLVTLHTRQAVNNANVTLPKFLNSNVQHTFSTGQLRFNGFAFEDPDDQGNRFVRYQLLAAIDHQFRWTAQAEDGEAGASETARHLYQRMSFSGLWT